MIIQNPKKKCSVATAIVRETLIHVRAQADAALNYPVLRRRFRRRHGYSLDLRSPTSFSEKVQWRKLNDRNPLFPILSDKLRVREFISDRLGARGAARVLPKLYATSTGDVNQIASTEIPPVFAFKANHASGFNIFVRANDRVDWDAIGLQATEWMRRSHGLKNHEWAYQEIPRCVLIEELVVTEEGCLPDDVKFYMFDGNCGFIHHISSLIEERSECIHNPDWSYRNVQRGGGSMRGPLPPPRSFELMCEIAQKLSRGIDAVRVDFLVAGARFVLNELTVYPSNGMTAFNPTAFDFEIGELWTLPRRS
jgi:hypothetical protein